MATTEGLAAEVPMGSATVEVEQAAVVMAVAALVAAVMAVAAQAATVKVVASAALAVQSTLSALVPRAEVAPAAG